MSNGGLSKVRLNRMHDVMAGYVQSGEVPGIVTLISRRSETHVNAIGKKAVGAATRSRSRHLPHLLVTKPITAAATLILVKSKLATRLTSRSVATELPSQVLSGLTVR